MYKKEVKLASEAEKSPMVVWMWDHTQVLRSLCTDPVKGHRLCFASRVDHQFIVLFGTNSVQPNFCQHLLEAILLGDLIA